MKTTKFISIVERVEERNRIVCVLQRGIKMFFGVLIQRDFEKKYVCLYIGLNHTEYEIIRKDSNFVESLPGHFIGIASDSIDVKQLTADKLLIPKPTHYIGFVKPEVGEMTATLIAFADSVQDRLETNDNESA